MENLFFAVSLALVNNTGFIINTNNYDQTSLLLQEVLRTHTKLAVIEIDLQLVQTIDELLEQMTQPEGSSEDEENSLSLYNVIIWKHLNHCSQGFQKQLLELFNQLKEYDTNHHKLHPKPTITIQGKVFKKPNLNIVIGLLSITSQSFHTNLIKALKEQFWFSQFYLVNKSQGDLENIGNLGDQFVDYETTLLAVRHVLPCIFQSTDIIGYIHSLIIHIRNHRLMTLAPIQTRLSSATMDNVTILAKAIIGWKNRKLIMDHQLNLNTAKLELFVTPVYCKIAIRKIGYWLVDWQIKDGLFDLTNQTIAQDPLLENRRKLVINILAGEWYGSEWEYVKEYLGNYYAVYDPHSNTGFTNKIIEDSIKLVKPPV